MPGLEAISLVTDQSFPRHSHDRFGIGIFTQGAQRSWSHLGKVEAAAGNIIMVNPGEIHDGIPLEGPRSWRMVYLDPERVVDELQGEMKAEEILLHPVVDDPQLRDWYAAKDAHHQWSRGVLAHQITTRLHEREAAAPSNFAGALERLDSDQAQEITKDGQVSYFLQPTQCGGQVIAARVGDYLARYDVPAREATDVRWAQVCMALEDTVERLDALFEPVFARRMQEKLWQALYYRYDFAKEYRPQLEENLLWLDGELKKLEGMQMRHRTIEKSDR